MCLACVVLFEAKFESSGWLHGAEYFLRRSQEPGVHAGGDYAGETPWRLRRPRSGPSCGHYQAQLARVSRAKPFGSECSVALFLLSPPPRHLLSRGKSNIVISRTHLSVCRAFTILYDTFGLRVNVCTCMQSVNFENVCWFSVFGCLLLAKGLRPLSEVFLNRNRNCLPRLERTLSLRSFQGTLARCGHWIAARLRERPGARSFQLIRVFRLSEVLAEFFTRKASARASEEVVGTNTF